MPVLDLQLWVENDKVLYQFYEKPMVSEQVICRWSALSWNTKKVSLAGEVARRYFTTSSCLVDDDQSDLMENIIDKFRHKLMVSGYSLKEREIIVKEGRNRYFNVRTLADNGTRPLYRPSSWMKEERAVKKKIKGKTWYGKTFDSVMFVQSSPGEILRREIQKIMNDSGFKVRVVEKGGRQLKSILQRSDIEPQKHCFDEECPVCLTSPEGMCQSESVGYRIWCMPCEEVGIEARMDGETGRTARLRCKEHMKALQSDKESSNLREHCDQMHGGVRVQFGCGVVSRFPGDPLSRQLEEAIRIDQQKGISLNDKAEFVRPAGVRLTAARM